MDLIQKDESICVRYVCMSGCAYVWHGLLISHGFKTGLRGDQKCWPSGVSHILTPSEIPKKLQFLFRVGLHGNFFFFLGGGGAHPNPGPTWFNPLKVAFCFMIWKKSSTQKLLMAHPNLRPTGFTPPSDYIIIKNCVRNKMLS
jgi:hypothetical protein